MARYPGATWRPLDARYVPSSPINSYNRLNLHIAVSEADSLHGYFNQRSRASSHFYVRKNGTVEQYIDTATRAEADLEGNDATISVETQGGKRRANTEPWTPAQIEALARLYAWAVTTHDIPRQIATDSRIGTGSHGLSWHRLGIDGNFPDLPSPLAGRNQRGGGMHYSTSRGKACPGNAKIKQVDQIFARATELLRTTTPAPAPEPTPSPRPTAHEEDDMHIIRRGTSKDPKRRYALVSGGRAIEIARASYVRYRTVGHQAIQIETADYDRIVKAWR